MSKEQIQPTFTKDSADIFYPSIYSTPRQINLPDHHWFPPTIAPDTDGFVPFDNSPIRPRDIRSVLSNANKNSAPGPDGLSYGVLSKLDSTHLILATLFNKVQTLGSAPPSWGESVVKPIYKKGDTSDPSNFRMISLTGCIGKTYHLILAKKLTNYLTVNKLIDVTMQNAIFPASMAVLSITSSLKK